MRRISGLDDIARILFPDNKNHQRAFIAVWLGIKYADGQFLPSCRRLPDDYGISPRTFEIVRAKLKKLGLIRRVSHFSREFGCRAGWVFCGRFCQAARRLGTDIEEAMKPGSGPTAKRRDRDSLLYV